MRTIKVFCMGAVSWGIAIGAHAATVTNGALLSSVEVADKAMSKVGPAALEVHAFPAHPFGPLVLLASCLLGLLVIRDRR